MFGSAVLEIAIGLVVIYILLAILTSTVIEYISVFLGWRGKNLEAGIRMLLNDKPGTGVAKLLYNHSLVKNLSKSNGKPSYLPSRNFALALLDSIPVIDRNRGVTFDGLRAGVNILGDRELKKSLLALLSTADNDLEKALNNIEKWFDDSMDRVSGWYNRKTRVFGLFIAVVAVVAINADSFMIGNILTRDATLRESLVELAGNPQFNEAELTAAHECGAATEAADAADDAAATAAANPADATAAAVAADAAATATAAAAADKSLICQIQNDIALPLGWSMEDPDRWIPDDLVGWTGKVLGLLATALAVSVGAPFWFDLLGKLLSLRQGLRQSGPPPGIPANNQPSGS